MNWTEFAVEFTRVFQAYYTLVSVVGVAVNAWAAIDSYQDLRSLRLAKINSLVEKTGRITFRDAVSIIGTHLVFLALGLLSLTSPVNVSQDINREIFVILFIVIASATQTIIVVTQSLNQYDRIAIRNILIQESRESNFSQDVSC